MSNAYPQYQYSVFIEGRKDQLVIRTETFEELTEAKKNIDKITEKVEKRVEEELGVCDKCQAPNIRSKKGNIVCSKFCWAPKS